MFAVITVLVSVIIVRFGFLEMKPAMATFFGGLAIAGLSILVGLGAFAAIWQNGSRGMSRILLALLIDAIVLAYPAYLGLQYRKLPPIHDITTDPIDPPRFEALARLRAGEGANSAVYAGLYSAEQQRIAYPDIETAGTGSAGAARLRTDAAARQQAQMACYRRAPAAIAAPHRPHRGGGAHDDHGLPRGRRDPHHARW